MDLFDGGGLHAVAMVVQFDLQDMTLALARRASTLRRRDVLGRGGTISVGLECRLRHGRQGEERRSTARVKASKT